MDNKEAIEIITLMHEKAMNSVSTNTSNRDALEISIKALNIFEKARDAGFRGEEVEFYIGGRKFAIRELAQ